jgi:hypothetical protein
MDNDFVVFGFEFINKLKILSIKYQSLLGGKYTTILDLLKLLNNILMYNPSIIYYAIYDERELTEKLFTTKNITLLLDILDTNKIAKKYISSDLKNIFLNLFNNADEDDITDIWISIEKFLSIIP